MGLLRPEATAESGAAEGELLPQPDGERPSTPEESAESDPLAELGAEVDGETDVGDWAPENGAVPLDDEPLDPGLAQLFAEAREEVEESTAASELPDIPIRDLLSELVSLSLSLGIERPPATGEPVAAGPASDAPTTAEPAIEREDDSLEPEPSPDLEETQPWLGGSRRHALHGILLSLTLAMAIASILIGAEHIVSSGKNQVPIPTPVATAQGGVAVRQLPAGQPTPEPGPVATPTSAPTRQPAYFLYTVQRGDTLTYIAAAFGLSLDHILWTNPDVLDDPNLLLVGDKLLIPNVGGMIYYVNPGDILSAIARVLPPQAPSDAGPVYGPPAPP